MLKYKMSMFSLTESILLMKSKNNDGVVPHSHDFVELVYIASGKGIHSIKGKSYMVSAGDLFIICTPDDHSLHPLQEESACFQWINCIFEPDFIQFDLFKFSPECRYIGTEGFEMNTIFHAMLSEFINKEPGYLDVLRSYLMIVLTKLSRLSAVGDSAEDYVNLKKRNYLKKAVEYIHRHYTEDISLQTLSDHLSLSSSYIGKIFKELKGTSPVNYLIQFRVEQSCKLLLETSLPAYKIANESGFKDIKFFYKVFRRFTGLSPGEYKSKYK